MHGQRYVAAITAILLNDLIQNKELLRVPDSIFVCPPNDITTFAGFCRETLVKLSYRKYVPCCFTTAYTQKTLEISDAVESLDRTRLSRIEPVGRIFRIGHIAPVAQWTE